MTDQKNQWHLSPDQSQEADREEYRALSGWAVAAAALGAISAVALVDPVAWLAPLLGVLCGLFALRRIARRAPDLTGRKAAIIGLSLSLFFGSLAVGQWTISRQLLLRQARQMDLAWFDALAAGQPQRAFLFRFRPEERPADDDRLWAAYRSDPKLRDALEKFTAERFVRTMLQLGKKATVRYYATENIRRQEGDHLVTQLYAVTFDKDGKKTSFFVRLVNQRTTKTAPSADKIGWRIVGIDAGVQPDWETL